MSQPDRDDETPFAVVVNHEAQYSIWPAGRELPAGWSATGFTGPKRACLAHIDEIWTDLRPSSLRSNRRTGEQEDP